MTARQHIQPALLPAGSTSNGDAGLTNSASTDGEGAAVSAPITEQEVTGYREQDRYLPINNIQRLMKAAVPDNIKISKDAKRCVQECTSEFISFITSEAVDKATREKRKTITGEDVLLALRTLGFDQYADVLLIYLVKYRELQKLTEPTRKRNRTSISKQEAVQAEASSPIKEEGNDSTSHPSSTIASPET